MARSREEIEAEMLALKAQFPQLASLNSNSSEAEWMTWIHIVSSLMHMQDKRLDDHQARVTDIASRAVGTSSRWYQVTVLQYQHGYLIEWDNATLQYKYPVTDVAALVVKRCAIEDPAGLVRIKVAKLDASGLPTPLDSPELEGLQSYMGKVAGAGDFLEFINQEADSLKLYMDVDYDPQVTLNTVKSAVEQVVTSYIANLPFNAQLRLTSLIDAIQQVNGVVDARIGLAEGKPLNQTYSTITSTYVARAGHMRIDPVFPLSNTITYNVAQ